MREVQYASRHVHYRPPNLISKRTLISLYALTAIILIFTILTKNAMLLFIFITLASSIINYQTNVQTIRINPDPEVFGSLLLTRTAGLHWSLIMLLIPTLFIDIYTARLDKDTFIALILTIIANIIMAEVSLDFVIMGIILVTARFIIGLMLNLILSISIQEIIFEHVIGFITNLLFFMAFGRIFIMLIG